METLELRPPRSRALLWGATSLALGLGSAVMALTQEGNLQTAGIIGAALFTIVGGLTAHRALRGPATLTLTPEGIHLADGGTITWDNLSELGEVKMGRVLGSVFGTQPGLAAKLKSPQRFQATLNGRPNPLQNRDFADGWDIAWPAYMLPDTPDAVAQAIKDYRATAR